MTEPLLTAAEVAELLRLDIRTIYQMAADGDLAPTYKIGHRSLRIPQATVDAFLAARETTVCK